VFWLTSRAGFEPAERLTEFQMLSLHILLSDQTLLVAPST
jgi:hypothetical protein